MPIISPSSYKAPLFCSNPHLQTIFPTILRRISGVEYQRRRIDTPDGDFLDLDWSVIGSPRLSIILHGLEGDSKRAYVMGMVRVLNRRGWDAVAVNFRGCGGEPNRKLQMYHSGETGDVATVIKHAAAMGTYEELFLVGFSLGGNVILKYLGER
ncbi:MAG: alpha/beta fold hydrolase, partial [Pseudomonadota bacterium]